MKQHPISDPSEQELFALADRLSWGSFHLAEQDRARLRELAAQHWDRLSDKSQVERIAYLFRLVFTCPILLDQPQGFEWIVKALKWELAYRKYNPKTDQNFWEAVAKVRGILRLGRPKAKAQDVATAMEVYRLMNQEGLTVTAAIERLAEARGGSTDTSAFWRALQRFQRERAQLEKWREQTPKVFMVGQPEFVGDSDGRSTPAGKTGNPKRKRRTKGTKL